MVLGGTTADAYGSASDALLSRNGLGEDNLISNASLALGKGGDYADIYLKSSMVESWAIESGEVKRGSFGIDQGFGVRAVRGEQSVLATSQRIDFPSVRQACNVVAGPLGAQASNGNAVVRMNQATPIYYGFDDPVAAIDSSEKTALLEAIDNAARRYDARVVEVMASLTVSRDIVFIARHDGYCGSDIRPLSRLDVMVQVMQNGRRESASRTIGGRGNLGGLTQQAIRELAAEAVDAALSKLDAQAAPAGTMTVVIGPGWNGVLLHEAVGHGLEGDFNRRGASAFAGRIGQRVAAPGVTIVDDGTVVGSRGSVNIDDEGTPGQCTTLIEDGILTGYMQDTLNARLAGVASTGNGRRESYDVLPMPRMTNTYMRSGGVDPDEIIASVKRGIYVAHLGGGQVDITSGRFVFSASEAFLIDNGKLTTPVKGATVLGDGPESLKRVKLIGNDLRIDTAAGVCGKGGQSVPVGVGQPTLRIDEMTVGGTA
ncbi:metalloprotease TldD [Pandoraea thiooxydans]|uniref:Metalloprotease TldD n=1 Tax=Pandoraea thiooxydans TaxID=445709 RepID=A0A0G3ETL6_9BURK|nr:metalloprotease TldD [Pandoraea thiooxydans]